MVTLAAGGLGVVPAADRLKEAMYMSGKRVRWLAPGVGLIAVLAAGIVGGAISAETVQPENVAEIALGLSFTSQTY